MHSLLVENTSESGWVNKKWTRGQTRGSRDVTYVTSADTYRGEKIRTAGENTRRDEREFQVKEEELEFDRERPSSSLGHS